MIVGGHTADVAETLLPATEPPFGALPKALMSGSESPGRFEEEHPCERFSDWQPSAPWPP